MDGCMIKQNNGTIEVPERKKINKLRDLLMSSVYYF